MAAHRKASQTLAALAMIISFIGVAVFYATNRAFRHVDPSNQYALATTEAQRAILGGGRAGDAFGGSKPHTGHVHCILPFGFCGPPDVCCDVTRQDLQSKQMLMSGILGIFVPANLSSKSCTSFAPVIPGRDDDLCHGWWDFEHA